MAYETIITETKGKVGLITLNRPDALNALNAQLCAEMRQALDTFEARGKIGRSVITGIARGADPGADTTDLRSTPHMRTYAAHCTP